MDRHVANASPLVQLLAGRWTLAVLAQLIGGRRYQDLYDALDGISYKVLTETLRRAERNSQLTPYVPSRCRQTDLPSGDVSCKSSHLPHPPDRRRPIRRRSGARVPAGHHM